MNNTSFHANQLTRNKWKKFLVLYTIVLLRVKNVPGLFMCGTNNAMHGKTCFTFSTYPPLIG